MGGCASAKEAKTHKQGACDRGCRLLPYLSLRVRAKSPRRTVRHTDFSPAASRIWVLTRSSRARDLPSKYDSVFFMTSARGEGGFMARDGRQTGSGVDTGHWTHFVNSQESQPMASQVAPTAPPSIKRRTTK